MLTSIRAISIVFDGRAGSVTKMPRSITNTLRSIFKELKIDIDKIDEDSKKIYIYLKNSYSYGQIYALGFRVVRKLSIKGVKAKVEKPLKIDSRDAVMIRTIEEKNRDKDEIYIVSGAY